MISLNILDLPKKYIQGTKKQQNKQKKKKETKQNRRKQTTVRSFLGVEGVLKVLRGKLNPEVEILSFYLTVLTARVTLSY